MYGIFTYIWLIFMVNVGKYNIHGLFGWKYIESKIAICFTISMDQVVDFYGCLESNDVFLKSADSVVFVELCMTL